MKYFEVDRHFIKEKLNEKIICILFVKTEEQLADVFTCFTLLHSRWT